MDAPRREFPFTLPVGFVDAAGRVHRHAVLHKMRGHEEALLHDPSLSGARLVTELIRGCLARVGDITNITSDFVSQLYASDRSYLLLELRRISLGDSLECSYTCIGCGAEVARIEDLGALEVRRLPDDERPSPIDVALEDGYTDREGLTHTTVRLRLARGADEELAARAGERDPLRVREVLILRCIETFGTLPRAALEAYGLSILRDLTVGDRGRIYHAIEGMPGVSFRRRLRCGACGARFEATLDTSSFFAPG